jgi:hypothetical protein
VAKVNINESSEGKFSNRGNVSYLKIGQVQRRSSRLFLKKKSNPYSDKALHLFGFINSIMVDVGYVTWKATVTTE